MNRINLINRITELSLGGVVYYRGYAIECIGTAKYAVSNFNLRHYSMVAGNSNRTLDIVDNYLSELNLCA